jgi:hypothetical protein
MRKKRYQKPTENPYKPFDGYSKTLLLSEEFEVLSFFLLPFGYILISCVRLPNELRLADGTQYEVDALFKAQVKLPNGTIIETCINVEFQHSNDPKMAKRVYDYRDAIKEVHKVGVVLPIVVYTGESRCTMNLKDNDDPFHSFPHHIPLVDITQMEAEQFSANDSVWVRFFAIFSHRFNPDALAQFLKACLLHVKNTQGMSEMKRIYKLLESVITDTNLEAMRTLEEIYREFPELEPDPNQGIRKLYEAKLKSKTEEAEHKGKSEGIEIGKSEGIEIGKSEGIEIGKSEGMVEGRIESAELMMANGGMSFEGASAILRLSEMEQVMLRQRMAKNGH